MEASARQRFEAAWARSPLRMAPLTWPEAGLIFEATAQGVAQLARDPSADLAELEQYVAALAMRPASRGAPPTDLLAALAAARLALGEVPAMAHFWDWLASTTSAAAVAGAAAAEREHYLEILGTASPLVMVHAEVPALIAVANPGSVAVEAACARLLMTVVRLGARHAIVELSWCAPPALVDYARQLARLAAHPQLRAVTLVVVGQAAATLDLPTGGEAMVFVARFDEAVRLTAG